MSAKEYLNIVLEILKNWQIIVTVIAMLLIISFSNFIVKYRRKPKKGKQKKIISSSSNSSPAPDKPAQETSMDSPDTIGESSSK